MKKTLLSVLLAVAFVTASAQDVMRKEKDGTYIVNTTTLAQDVEGYNGPTPVEVYIKKNKIVKVVPLKRRDITARHLSRCISRRTRLSRSFP